MTAGTVARAAAQQAPRTETPLTLAGPEGSSAPPVVITLQDAIERARQNDAQFQSTVADVDIARGDVTQAKAAELPAFSATTAYIGNQAGPNPTGRFVSMDGVNMYREWAGLHQEFSANTFTRAPVNRARAAQAVAEAKLEIARRGLVVTVTKNYYALVAAQRKYAAAQQAAQTAARFLDVAQQQQRAGQVAQSDVIKADIQYRQQQQNYQDAQLAMDSARLALAVLLFPTLNENFTVVDDRATVPALPPFADIRGMAQRANPDLRSAMEGLRAAAEEVSVAKSGLLPSMAIDAVYGIEANEFALHSVYVAAPQLGELPNLGYMVVANLTIPLWDWGSVRAKVGQAQARQRQVQTALSQTERQIASSLFSKYNEAFGARAAVDNLRQVASLAAESLRLTNLRYQAGQSSALEVVDAQNTLVQAQNAAEDAETRFRVAIADLQTVTGTF